MLIRGSAEKGGQAGARSTNPLAPSLLGLVQIEGIRHRRHLLVVVQPVHDLVPPERFSHLFVALGDVFIAESRRVRPDAESWGIGPTSRMALHRSTPCQHRTTRPRQMATRCGGARPTRREQLAPVLASGQADASPTLAASLQDRYLSFRDSEQAQMASHQTAQHLSPPGDPPSAGRVVTLVAVHGNGGGAHRFARVAPLMPPDVTLVAVTLPGLRRRPGGPRAPLARRLRRRASPTWSRRCRAPASSSATASAARSRWSWSSGEPTSWTA